ncbi:MAG: 30S ribosomal protein S20 [Thermodesulfobacteriota bacterium]
MANHKSALKRNRQSQVRRARNRANKSEVKTAIRRVTDAIEQKSLDGAQEALKAAIPVIARAAVKGAMHKNTASRKVSRLTRHVNELVKEA